MKRDTEADTQADAVISETHRLDAEPAKVWRAVSQEHYRVVWLPDQQVLEVLSERPPVEIELLIEERNAPFARSVVRFGVDPLPDGGTLLTIRHRLGRVAAAGNDNLPLMRAA